MTAVRFLGLGYAEFEDITLEVNYIAQWARGFDRFDPCAFCAGDPLAEQPCTECGGGYIKRVKAGELAEPGIPVLHSYAWGIEQHIPHASGCTVTTYIDRWYAVTPHGETCPVCEGRPT